MDGAGIGDGDVDDVGSLAICEDAEVGSFLADFICEEGLDALDEDFLEEFRKSESFAQVLREHGIEQGANAAVGGGSSSQSISSRRASLNESERGTVQNNSSQRDSSRGLSQQDPFPPLVPSHQSSSSSRRIQEAPRKGSSSPDKRRKKTDQARQKIVLSDSSSSNDDSEDEFFDGSRSRKKLNDKLKIRPPTSPSMKQRKWESPHKKQNKSQERAPVHQSPVKKKSKSDFPLEGTPKRRGDAIVKGFNEYARNHVQATTQPIRDFRIRLVDLKMLTNLFPNGLPGKIKVTSKLLEELEQCELKIRGSKMAFPKKVSIESSKESSNEQVLHHHQTPKSHATASVPEDSDEPLYIDVALIKPRSEEKDVKVKREKEDKPRKLDKLPPKSASTSLEKIPRKAIAVVEEDVKQMASVQEKNLKTKILEVESKRKEAALLVEKIPKKKLAGDKNKSRARALSSSPSPERSPSKKALDVVGKSKEARSSLEKSPKKKPAFDKNKSRALSSSPSPERSPSKKALDVVGKSKEARSSLEKSPKKKRAFDKNKSRALSSSPSPERSPSKKAPEVVSKSKEALSSLEKNPKKKLAVDKNKSRALSSSPSPERSPSKKVPEVLSKSKEVRSSLEKSPKKKLAVDKNKSRALSSSPSPERSPIKKAPEIVGKSKEALSSLEKSHKKKVSEVEVKNKKVSSSPEKSHKKRLEFESKSTRASSSPERSFKKSAPYTEHKSREKSSLVEKSPTKKTPAVLDKQKSAESPEKSPTKKTPEIEKAKITESPEKSPTKTIPEVEKSKRAESPEKSLTKKTVEVEDKPKEAISSLDKNAEKSTDVECKESTESILEKIPEKTALESPDKQKSKETKSSPKKPFNPFSVLSFATLNEKLKAKNTFPDKSKQNQSASPAVKDKTGEGKEPAVLDSGDKSMPHLEKTSETNIPATSTPTESTSPKDLEPLEPPPTAAPKILDISESTKNIEVEKNSAISSPLKETAEATTLAIPVSSNDNKLSITEKDESVETAAQTSIPIEIECAAASKESEILELKRLEKEKAEVVGPANDTVQLTPLPGEDKQAQHEEIKPIDAAEEKSLSTPVSASKPEEQAGKVLEDISVPKSSASPEKSDTFINIEAWAKPPSPDQVDTDMPSPPPSPSHSQPGDDSREASSPEVTEPKKSSSPDRVISKKKNIIESSSDDGDTRKEDTDITDVDDRDTPPDDGKNKSSDDEVTGSKKSVRFAHNPSIQRERDQEDSRSGKFGEFEMERQRKQRKDGKLSRGKIDPLEEIMKDTLLTGSFRIPRKTSTSSKKTAYIDSIIVRTPLTGAAAEVPKENMQFEKFREGLSNKHILERKEKDWNKNRGGDWNTRNPRDTGDSGNSDFRGGNSNKANKESGPMDRYNLKDDGRKVVLLPEEGKLAPGNAEDVVDSTTTPRGGDNDVLVDPEPDWEDDGPQGDSPDIGIDDNNENIGDNINQSSKVHEDLDKQSNQKKKDDGIKSKEDLALTIQNIKKDDESETNTVDLPRLKLQDIKKEKDITEIKQETDDATSAAKSTKKTKEEKAVLLNPEVPIKTVEVSPFSIGAMMLLMQDPNPELPDVEKETNLAESTVIKLAWWISKADFENSTESGSSKEWYIQPDHDSDDNSDGGASESSYLDRLECSLSEDDEIFHSLPRDLQRKTMGPIDEFCGKQLLESKYRSGPGDKFSNIFQTRGGISELGYLKTNLQTQCTLCNHFLIGKAQVATHVLSNYHREKMSQAGLNDLKTGGNSAADKQKDKNTDVKKSVADSTSSEIDKEEKERKDKEKKDDGKHKDKKRKRSKSKDGSSSDKGAEIGVTSTGLPIKIPAGAMPDKEKDKDRKRRSDSKEKSHKRNRSRSKSPKDRDRSRKSRSRSPHSSSRRRRSRSRDRERDRAREREPIVRISRSPAKLRESRRERSTSAERVKKFLAKTQRRSRSPSNGYNRKRHRHSSPTADTGVLPKKTNQEFHEKLTMTAEGKWTDELEGNWKMMELEEAIFMEQFGEKSKTLKTTPESHPDYGNEWTAFWERRYQEIEDEGKEDPDKHNYVPEWKDFWNKRLREVLDKEYEDGINAIKVRHGVDIETLQKIRNTPKEPVVVAQLLPQQPVVMMQVPRPVPPPSCLPMGVPPPQIMMAQSPSIQGTVTPSSKSASDDMNARPMSISDGGDVRPATSTVKPAAPSPAVTTTDIMSTWNKLKSGESVTSKQGSSHSGIHAPPVQQPLRSLSISKSISERSVGESSASIESYTFSSGMDIGQVLRIMTNLEDQLSFFAPKVIEYFHKAEELDLKRPNKSYTLLQDDDFVAMMFQIRDRFMAQIRAHVLPKGILNELNLAAYGLNGILDHPDCQKRRPRAMEPEKPPEPQPQSREERAPAQHSASTGRSVNETFTRPTSKSLDSNPMRRLSDLKKKEISVLLTHFLLTMGRDDIRDAELKELVLKMCAQQSTSSAANSSASNTPQQSRGGEGGRNSDSSAQPVRFGESSALDPWRMPERNMTKIYSVASTQSAGTAVPELPNVIIPPPFYNPTSGSGGTGPIRFGAGSGSSGGEGGNRNDRSRGRGYGQYDGGDNYMSSGSSSGPGGSGRHSPFSRRDFTGNPAHSSYSYHDKESAAPSTPTTAPVESRRYSASTQEKRSTKNTDGNNMPVVTVGTTSKLASIKKRSSGELYRDPEIQMKQLTKFKGNRPALGNRLPSNSHLPYLKEERGDLTISRRASYDYNREYDHDRSISSGRGISVDHRNSFAEEQIAYSSRRPEGIEEVNKRRGSDGEDERRVHSIRRTSRDENSVLEESQQHLPKLPPGIMNMIMKERNMKQKQETAEMGEILSDATLKSENDSDSDNYRRRKRKRKRKKKKSKAKKNNVSSDEEEDDSDGSKYARNRSRERRSRRERKKKRSKKDNESSSVQSDYEKEKVRERQPPPPSPNYARLSSRRRSSRSCSYDDQDRYQSRSRHISETKQRSESTSRHGERSYREHYPPSPPRWDDKRRKRQSGSPPSQWNRHPSRLPLNKVYQGMNQITAMTAPAVSPLPFHESDWENSGNEENSQAVILVVDNPRSIAPALDVVDLSEDEIEFLPTPVKDSSKVLLQESNVKPKEIERKTNRRNLENLDMFAPSPPASAKSGSSDYRRTKERRSVTTINIPGSKPMPRSENCLGENRRGPSKEVSTKIPDENPKDSPNRNVPKEKNLVTSVSETFWTANDDDAKSLSSVSSVDIRPSKLPCSTVQDNPCEKEAVLKPVSTTTDKTTAVPLSVCVAEVVQPRNYRVSRDSEKEPGELSSCSSSENYE